MTHRKMATAFLVSVGVAFAAMGGPHGQPGINGYVRPDGMRHADPLDPDAIINPIFRGWATGVLAYAPADQAWSGAWNDPSKALGADLAAAERVWEFIQRHLVDRVHGDWFWRITEQGQPDSSLPKVSEWKGPYHASRACFETARRLRAGVHEQKSSPLHPV